MSERLEIRLFGGLYLALGATPLTTFMSNKVPALLAYLAVNRQPQRRETLAALLWGGLPEADAKNNLRQSLTNLRKFVDAHVLIDRETVALNPAAPYALDVAAFEKHLLGAAAAQPADWQAAGELYRGDFLAGFSVRDAPEFEEWMLAQRARYRELALHALHALTQQTAAAGDYAHAVDAATRLLALDPWREEAHRQLMLLKARTGQRSAALAQYEICRQVLAEGLGVEPSPETTALYDRLRAAQQGLRHNLPANLTDFVGRGTERAALRQRLADPACRLVTLTGPGGVGKTRLALQAAADAAEAFINGAWLAPLGAATAETLIEHLADAVGLTLKSGPPKRQLFNFLRAKELLLVLDNFEHLVEAAALLSELLQAAPDVKLLVTSRERLDLQSEWVVELAGLGLPASAEVPPEACDAGRLFLQTARRQQAAFTPTAEDGAAMLEICRLVAGLPLGIELAAARIRTLACAAIAAEIRQGIDSLATTQRDVPERQRSLRAVVESSCRSLTATERRAFVQLAVFAGGFTPAAAELIAGATPAILATLVDKSLVRQQGGRYDLHEVLRRFADQELRTQPAENAALTSRHGEYYAGWVADAFAQAERRNEEEEITALAAELDNLRAAWRWATAGGHAPALGQLFPPLYRFMDVRGHYQEGAECFAQAAAALGPELTASDDAGRLAARLTVGQAMFLLEVGRSEPAVALFEAGREYFQRVEEPSQLVRCLNGLGRAARNAGQYALARTYCTDQLRLAQAHGLRQEEATALNNLGVIVSSLGEYAAAIQHYQAGLALRRELGDRVGQASTLINLVTALVDSGDDSQTARLLSEALQITREFNDPRRTAAVLTNLGAAARRAGKPAEEKAYYLQALATHRESGHRMGIALALNNLGSVAAREGETAEARRYLRLALAEARAGGFDFVALDALIWQAALWAREGRRQAAVELLALPLQHPAADSETVEAARAQLPEIGAGLTPEAIAAALAHGAAQPLAGVIDALLAG